jgi:P27 family predicted phage terminase small subunit
MAGRKPKPDELKAKSGTLRKSRVNNNKPQFGKIEALPLAPEYLDEEGARQWRTLVDQLDRAGMLQKTDLTVLAAYCLEWAMYVKHAKAAMDGSDFYQTLSPEGVPTSFQVHPCTILANRALANCLKIASEFGFTPASRSRISVPTPHNQQETTVKKLLKKTA